jgi:hypothetical protein
LNKSATNIPSEWKIASIGPDDAIILPHDANPDRIKFSERTGAISATNCSFEIAPLLRRTTSSSTVAHGPGGNSRASQ